MKLQQINNACFTGGNIHLRNINQQNICTIESIKKIAEDKDIDIFISRINNDKYLPNKNLFTATASKNSFNSDNENITGSACTIINKKAGNKKSSIGIFNVVMNAIENLEKKFI